MKKIKVDRKIIKIHSFLILISIIFVSTLVVAGYSIDRINNFSSNLKSSIEQQKRSDARELLKDVVDRFDNAVKTNQVDPMSTKSVSDWASYNFCGLRNGSSTSNGFIIDLGEEMYISDSSVDYNIISSTSQRTMQNTIEYYDDSSKQITKVFNRMRLGIDTSYGENISCTLNGQREWLEWVNYPTTVSVGINGESISKSGLKNPDYKKYVFVLRTKQNEIFRPYKPIFSTLSYIINIIYILLVAVLFFIMCIMFYIVYVEYNIKWCCGYRKIIERDIDD